MKKIAQSIVRLRKLILTAAVLLLIPSAIGAVATRINYDVLTYLPQELDSMIGEVALEDDFHLASTGMITVEGLPTNELIAMKKDIDAVPGVTQTFWLSDVIDPSIPTEMLPADVQQFMFGKNDSTMLIVRFDAPSASDETMNAVKQIKQVLRHDCYFGGMSVILQDTKALINEEMPLYILCAVGASMLVLFLSLESTITPVLFMLGLLFPIAYNFGTNIFLGQISYITQALSTVLQLGVTMDFSIFLLHRYQEEKELRSSNEEAMVTAICKTMTSITASSLTTIAGFLALCAMRLTLGRDIGVVMAKGVALGVICTIVILPALILTFDQQVEKYKHRTIVPKLTKLSYFVSKHAMPIVVVFLVLLVPFVVAQQKTEVYYTLFDSLPQDLTGIVGTNKLGEDFGMTTSHFILVDEDLTATQVSDLCDELKDVDGITQVVSLDSITGPGFQTELLPDSVTEILQSGGYKLILANSSYKTGTDAINNQLTEMNDLIKAVDPNGVITGEGAMTKDLIEVADVDFKNVNVWSIMAVAAIILISFRSLSIPVLLVASIEAAISINMGIPYFTGTDAINNQLTEMNDLIKAVDPNGVITGEGAMTKDLIEVADVDFKNVNVWSIMAVAAIILISFRSLSIPVLLVASIEAAISINMGIPYFTGTQLPFIASIVIGTIQLGATVDYSILMTTRYHEERSYGRTPREAAQQSLEHCSQSILTSGLTFFAATVGVAAISKMELLQSICRLISRGALISMAVILVVLPAALMLLDWVIRHTTMHWLVPESSNAKKSDKE